MIVVTVEYDSSLMTDELWRGTYSSNELFDDIALVEFRDAAESIVGLVFAEEQDRVDIRIRPFGPFDQFEEPLFITIDVTEDELPFARAECLAEQFVVHFGTHIDAHLPGHVPFRVWVRRITGSFTETARNRT